MRVSCAVHVVQCTIMYMSSVACLHQITGVAEVWRFCRTSSCRRRARTRSVTLRSVAFSTTTWLRSTRFEATSVRATNLLHFSYTVWLCRAVMQWCRSGSHNLIADGFFDVGQLRPGTKLLQLEEYCKAEVDQKRPILLINAKPEFVEYSRHFLIFLHLSITCIALSESRKRRPRACRSRQ